MSVFVIAEAGSSHDNDESKAFRLIEAAKSCGADAVKFQWTSDAIAMSKRRGLGGMDSNASVMYRRYLEKPVSWLESLKAHADKAGIEFMCTVYLIEDIATIAPLVKRFKVSAFESSWLEFLNAHWSYAKPIIASINAITSRSWCNGVDYLYCVSKYPTALEDLKLGKLAHGRERQYSGLSDHTANILTGAAAVAAGAKIVEAHIRLSDTSHENPDYGHSLVAFAFSRYVQNIRTVERML